MMRKAGLYLTPEEEERMEVTDFGLNDPYHEGLMLHVYVNTKRCCAKELPDAAGTDLCGTPPPAAERGESWKGKRHSAAVTEKFIHVPGEPTLNQKQQFRKEKKTSIPYGMRSC